MAVVPRRRYSAFDNIGNIVQNALNTYMQVEDSERRKKESDLQNKYNTERLADLQARREAEQIQAQKEQDEARQREEIASQTMYFADLGTLDLKNRKHVNEYKNKLAGDYSPKVVADVFKNIDKGLDEYEALKEQREYTEKQRDKAYNRQLGLEDKRFKNNLVVANLKNQSKNQPQFSDNILGQVQTYYQTKDRFKAAKKEMSYSDARNRDKIVGELNQRRQIQANKRGILKVKPRNEQEAADIERLKQQHGIQEIGSLGDLLKYSVQNPESTMLVDSNGDPVTVLQVVKSLENSPANWEQIIGDEKAIVETFGTGLPKKLVGKIKAAKSLDDLVASEKLTLPEAFLLSAKGRARLKLDRTELKGELINKLGLLPREALAVMNDLMKFTMYNTLKDLPQKVKNRLEEKKKKSVSIQKRMESLASDIGSAYGS